MKPRKPLLLFALAVLVGASASWGQNLVTNGSFEDGDFDGGNYERVTNGDTDITDWTIGGDGVDWHSDGEFTSPYDGDLVVDVLLDAGAGSGTISQSFSTDVGEDYHVIFYMAGPDQSASGNASPRRVRVEVASENEIFSATVSPNSDIDWEMKVLPFTATGTETTLTFSNVDLQGYWGAVIDDVGVFAGVSPTAIPSLTSWAYALLALLLVGMGWSVLARRQQA